MISKVVSFLTKQIKQKKKLLLKSLFILLLGFSFLPQQTYFSMNEVYAEDTSGNDQKEKQKDSLASMNTFMQSVSNIAFALLWPLVALAGLAMDNTMIYGSFMGLDVSLWSVWQIVRSFANYSLGFLFLAWIIYYNLSRKDLKNLKISVFLKKVLIASVLIQASWFLMMVLVDLSTILTYSIGGLPYSVLKDQTLGEGEDSRMFKMNVDLSLGDYTADVEGKGDTSSAIKYYWHVTGTQYIAPCKTAEVKFSDNQKQSFIVGREFIALPGNEKGKGEIPMAAGYCMYYGALVVFNDFYKAVDGETYETTLSTFINAFKESSENAKKLSDAGIIFPLSNGQITYLEGGKPKNGLTVDLEVEGKKVTYGSKIECDGKVGVVPSQKGDKEWSCLYKDTNITIANILQKARSMTGPFAALYSSMSLYSNLQTEGKGLWKTFVISFVNVCFAVILVLPLIALVVVLFARIGLLWVAIAISPFLVLVNVFDNIFKLPGSLSKYLGLKQLVQLLLAPVLISFAVGMSLVFMTVLKQSVGIGPTDKNAYLNGTQTSEFYKNFEKISGMDVSETNNGTDLDILGFIKVKLDSTLLNVSWLITMFFGLGITWFLLFFAIKQTEIGEKIGGTLQGLGETMITSTPIIPIGKNGLSWNGLTNAPDQISSHLKRDIESKDRARLQSLLDFGKTDFQKQGSSYVRQTSTSFNDAFGISESDYSNTAGMLERLDTVYQTNGWEGKKDDIGKVYGNIIGNASSKANLEQIVEHVNDHGKGNISIDGISKKVGKVEYKIVKGTDGKYVLQGGETSADAK